ncbi:MAG: tRNA-dihydrouridine synthase family protein [Chlamydiae bacterium]|nr:tRNA-dihydrouridine synthase family protein [Chlamydiota bacterium]
MASLLPRDSKGCPYLLLAPMEGVGDRCFRKAMASIGGFDEAVTDFLRVPANAHIESLAKKYEPFETTPIPLAVQLMGSDPELLAAMAVAMEKKQAPRIDLNCGCPSNTVTGKGAGSSLLKDPEFLHENAQALVRAVSTPVTLKMRSGYEDTSLFQENLLAAQESGVKYITLHPRTKVDGYGPPAKWEYIAQAKDLLKIPVVGNGDILEVKDALAMLKQTSCDALMIGRGSIINPFIFHQIRAHFHGREFHPKWNDLLTYFSVYLEEIADEVPQKIRVSKLKQLMSFQFKGNVDLLENRQMILRLQCTTVEEFLTISLPLLKEGWLKTPGNQL